MNNTPFFSVCILEVITIGLIFVKKVLLTLDDGIITKKRGEIAVF